MKRPTTKESRPVGRSYGRVGNFGDEVAIRTEAYEIGPRHLVRMGRCIDKGHLALRRGRVSVPGAAYLVTAVVAERTPCFADDGYARVVAGLHGVPGAFLDATVLAWVLMPDHWHGVVALGERFPLPSVIKNFKTRSCRELRWACDFRGPLWQAAYHDRRLPDPDAITAAIAYLLANPVRAGLCAHPADYPYTGSHPPP